MTQRIRGQRTRAVAQRGNYADWFTVGTGGTRPAIHGTAPSQKGAPVNAAIAPGRMTAADRCDRCGARAYIRVTLPGGGELLFCAHHGRAHESALRAADAVIHDQSDELTDIPPVAPDAER